MSPVWVVLVGVRMLGPVRAASSSALGASDNTRRNSSGHWCQGALAKHGTRMADLDALSLSPRSQLTPYFTSSGSTGSGAWKRCHPHTQPGAMLRWCRKNPFADDDPQDNAERRVAFESSV